MDDLITLNPTRGHEAADRRRAAARERWTSLRPDTAQVYIENRCHLACEHCYETEDTHPALTRRDRLSVEDYEKLFDDLRDLGVLYLGLTGGEIFLRRDALEIVAAARARRFHITLFTSGTLIDEAKADRLAELRVNVVEISLYSHDAEVHDAFTRVAGSWAKSINALKLLGERGVETVLKANLMRLNIDHVDDLIALAGSLGADWQFDPSVKPRMDGDTAPLELALSPDEIRRKVLNRPDLYEAFRKNGPEAYCKGEAHLLASDTSMCGAARSTLSIEANGDVRACGFFPISAGNIREQPLVDIWLESEQLNEVRTTTLAGMSGCTECEVRSTCSPCMAYAVVEHGDHRACNSTSRLLAESIALQAERRNELNHRLDRGAELPILGDRQVPLLATARKRPALSTE